MIEKIKNLFEKKSIARKCKLTGESFELSSEEIDNYRKFSLPLPNTVYRERLRRKLAFISSGRFYQIKCDKTGGYISSVYHQKSQFTIYKQEKWLEKEFDATKYSRKYNLDRAFNEQFIELWNKVPRPNVIAKNFENSTNVHYVSDILNCTNITIGKDLINCHNSYFIINSRNCIDNLNLINSENCYECSSCIDSKNLFFSTFSKRCENSYFLSNCINCKNCIFCTDMKNSEYCIYNKKTSKKEYFQFLEDLQLNKRDFLEQAKIKYKKFKNELKNNENKKVERNNNFLHECTKVQNSKNCYNSKNIVNSQNIFDSNNCFEGIGYGNNSSNLAQFAMIGDNATNIFNSIDCWSNVENLEYCSHCYDSHDLFACVGLSNKSYCILNKQYSENEYKKMRSEIIENLKIRKSWGSFLTPGFCGLPYNMSAAQVFMPLGRAPAKLMGFRWDDEQENIRAIDILNGSEVSDAESSSELANLSFSEVPQTANELLEQESIYLCEISTQEVIFNEFEIAFLVENKIAPPARSIFQRHVDRVRNTQDNG